MPVAVHVSVKVGVIEPGVVFKIGCCWFFLGGLISLNHKWNPLEND